MANYYTTYALAIEPERVPDARSTFDNIWDLIKSIPHRQILQSTSRSNWILDVILAITDAGHILSFKFLSQEIGTLSPEKLPQAIEELKLLLEQLSADPGQFVPLLSNYVSGCDENYVLEAVERDESTPMPIEWYGDYDDLSSLLHYLKGLSALLELALHRNLSIFHIQCDRFLENRQA